MTIFGPAWGDLTLDAVQAFLQGADDEPLLWEAKGTELHKGEVRRQVCAFANGHEDGYLILGASKPKGGGWQGPGVRFPEEPMMWITKVISDADRGVRPRPDFDVKAFVAADGYIAVVRVRPTSTPPCITNGTVYERGPGETRTVKDPVLLANLFARGDEARSAASDAAERAAMRALVSLPSAEISDDEEVDDGPTSADTSPVSFAVGVAATGNPLDVASRLFQDSLATDYWTRLRDLPSGLPPGYGRAPEPVAWSQTSLVWARRVVGAITDYDIAMCGIWDGSGGVAERLGEGEGGYLDLMVQHRVGPAWALADELVQRLRGFGDFYVALVFIGGKFPRSRITTGKPLVIKRGPMPAGVDADQLESIGRELMRSVGSPVGEPPIVDPAETEPGR